MNPLNRRAFLKLASALAANLGFAASWPAGALPPATAAGPVKAPAEPAAAPLVEQVADTLSELAAGRAPVLWLHGLSCSGCSVSFLNATFPDPASVLTRYISLGYNSVVSAASGDLARQVIAQRIAAKNTLLVVEGAVPVGMPAACRFGEEPFTELLARAAASAKAVIALGTCAAFGGIPAAPPSPTGATAVPAFLKQKGVAAPVINIPGCPAHPEWLVGTLVHVLKAGLPALTAQGTPQMYFGSVIHSRCPQFYAYNRGEFASALGKEGCLFKLGCLGIRTYADCPARRWNNKVNWCVEAGGPCIGCTQPEFAQRKDFPFYRLREKGA